MCPTKSWIALVLVTVSTVQAANSGWNSAPDTQFHIQTDEGPERYFKYQTTSGQYRKEKRLEDGTVVGSYGWIDADGYLRLRDYIADNQGYRILKTKNLFVGKDRAISEAVASAKKITPSAGVLVAPKKTTQYEATTKLPPIAVYTTSNPYPYVEISPNSIQSNTERPVQTPSSTYQPPFYPTTQSPEYDPTPSTVYIPATYRPKYSPETINPAPIASNEVDYAPYRPRYKNRYFQNGPTYPIDRNGQAYTGNGYDPQYPYYDGVAVTNDGFRYYLPRQYHEEQTLPGEQRSGSFGYIDPFGIRRVIYYNTAPGTGFQHKKNNRYVGFNATPYDPRPYR